MIDLSPAERASLRARAHTLRPVVSIGQHGLTPAVVHEIDVALAAHELVKIRVHGEDRVAREALLARVCEALGAAPIQHLGKLLIVYRPKPEAEKPARAAPRRRKVSGKTTREPPQVPSGRKGSGSARRTGAGAASKKSLSRVRAFGSAGVGSQTRPPTALGADAPRRRRRLVTAKTHFEGARNQPAVRRRRKNP
jgi:putative YhbY family RNA-binding protein